MYLKTRNKQRPICLKNSAILGKRLSEAKISVSSVKFSDREK